MANLLPGESKDAEIRIMMPILPFVPFLSQSVACTVTSRRLVITSENGKTEESYPLSKITGVVWGFRRNWWLILIGAAILLFGLSGLLAALRYIKYFGVWNLFVRLLICAMGGGLAWLGWRGSSGLLICQMAANKFCRVQGNPPELQNFISTLNAKLS